MLLKKDKLIYLGGILVIFIAGLLIRLYDMTDAPLDFHPTRQLHSALMSRGMYYAVGGGENDPAWRRDVSIDQWKLEGVVEPPILEWLVAFVYRMVGSAQLWVPRLFAILFWMIAALGIWLVSRKIIDDYGALVAVAFFLFYPYGIIASRSFQPETLLVALLVFSAGSALQWHSKRSWEWAVVAGILAGMAVLIKTVAIFFLAGMWLCVLLSENPLKKIFQNPQVWLIALLSVFPYLCFLLYTRLAIPGYAGQFNLRFFPQLWTQVGFYLRWLQTLRQAVGLEWLILGLFGVWLIEEAHIRWMWLGLWLGYLLLGFVLSYHISTHDYYHLPTYLMVSVGLGSLANRLIRSLKNIPKTNVLFILLLSFISCVYIIDIRTALKRIDYSEEVAFWQQLGSRFDHHVRVVALSEDYGYRLAYWGWISPVNWMSSDDINMRLTAGQKFDFDEYFNSQVQDKDYFLITDQDELHRQPLLQQKLDTEYLLIEKTDRYLLYDLRKLK